MVDGKKILAIIPARGGSKGIRRKNIIDVGDRPLISWTIEEAKKSKCIDRLILSSDDDEIICVAKTWGCEVPFIRPHDLAQDETPSIEVILHALNQIDERYDYVCLLQPTSLLRKVEHIDECITKCICNYASSCASVTEVTKHPYWMYSVSDDEILTPFIAERLIFRRQDLPKVFVLNGAIYVMNVEELLISKSIITDKTLAYKMENKYSIDIDTEMDLKIASFLLKNSDHES